jgi:D-alanyl-D-alanine carboxypeptidase (penicillin-binding protein 5/6)
LVPFGFVLVAAGYTAWALTQPLLSIQPKTIFAPSTLKSTDVAFDWPAYGQSAVGAPGYGILATHGDQKPLPTASIAKVMTAVAVLRQRPLHIGEQGPDIVITQEDVDSYHSFVAGDGSVVGVALGEHITEYQALQALLLPSANNMAVTLARWAFGSVDAYNTYANTYAKELGLNSIHITDPSGYDLKTVASAEDLTKLGTIAMLNPVFAEIVAQPNAKIPVQGTINNYNFMLGKSGNIGIKTGNNDGDKGAFLFASKQKVGDQDITIIGTIMGGPDLATVLKDSEPLTLSTARGFQLTTFVRNGQKIGSYLVPDEGSVDAVASEDLIFPTWNGMSFTVSATLKPLTGSMKAGTQIGQITVSNVTTHVSTSVPVKLSTSTKDPSVTWRLAHPLGD